MNNRSQLIPSVGDNSLSDLPGTLDSERRRAIKQIAALCGLALSTGSLSALAAALTLPTDMNRRRKTLLDKDQLALVRELGEMIIPTTDTPGAIAAGVHDFINHFVVYCATNTERQSLFDLLSRISSSDSQFLKLEKAQQIAVLTNMEQAKNGFTQTDRNNFKQFKALVLFGYYTSEIGATQELAYLAIPGGYKGNVKFSEIGKAWALPQ